MKNTKITLNILAVGKKASNCFQLVNSHMVLDVRMEDFRRKACLVVGVHMTETPEVIAYSSVVTRETVCIASTMAVLHDLEIKAVDVLNAYVMAPREK